MLYGENKRIDWGSRIRFWLCQLFGVYRLFVTFTECVFESPYFFLMLVIVRGISFVLFLWVCLSHEYKFTESALIFRAGPFRKTVALIDIFEVMPTDDGIPRSRGAVRVRYYMTGIAGDSFMMIPAKIRTEVPGRNCGSLPTSKLTEMDSNEPRQRRQRHEVYPAGAAYFSQCREPPVKSSAVKNGPVD